MSIAEQFYRKWYKIKEGVKLTNDQWKVINMMHECLREHNKAKLPHGTMLVNRQHLIQHLKQVKECMNATDKLMAIPENKTFANSAGGKMLAKIWNHANMTYQMITHFELKIPLERVHEDLSEELLKEFINNN